MGELVKTDKRLLSVLGDIKNSIQEIDNIDELLKVRAAGSGFEEAWKKYYQTSGFGFEQMFAGWEVKVRSERRMGKLLPKTIKHGNASRFHDETLDETNLEDLGISKSQSHRYQQLAKIKENDFETGIDEFRGNFKEPSTKPFYHMADAVSNEEKKKEYEKKAEGFNSKNIHIFNEDFREYAKKIDDNSIDLILTDPPYPKEFLPLWEDMFAVADRILKPSSFLVAYANHQNLDEIFRLKNNLKYYWTFKLDFTLKPLAMGRNLIATWKPILIYQKLPFKKIEATIEDEVKDNTPFNNEQRNMHDENWGQSIGKVEYLIDKFSKPNDLIFEPFAGTGTTLIAAQRMKRKCIGTEIEKKYIDLIKGRLNEELQL